MKFQKHNFPDGSFCLHGITNLTTSGDISAWYNSNGELVDCEWFPTGQPDAPRAIPATWRHVRAGIERLGPIWAKPRPANLNAWNNGEG